MKQVFVLKFYNGHTLICKRIVDYLTDTLNEYVMDYLQKNPTHMIFISIQDFPTEGAIS